jgi:lactase-phlorizin hydrolase
VQTFEPQLENSAYWITVQVVPWGFRKLLNWIKKEYNNPPVFVTENGVSDKAEFNDTLRIYYYTVSLFQVHMFGER